MRKGDNGRGSEKTPEAVRVRVCACVRARHCIGDSHHLPAALHPHLPPCRMDFRTPDLLDVWLEPPEDVFSTGSFLELGLHCPPPGVPVPRLQEQGLQGWEAPGGRGCVSDKWKWGGLRPDSDKKPTWLQPTLGERSGDSGPKIDVNCNYPHVQGPKAVKLRHEDRGAVSEGLAEFLPVHTPSSNAGPSGERARRSPEAFH